MGFLKRLIGKIASGLRRPVAYATAEWNRMAARERRLISILAGAVALLALLLTGYLIIDALQEISTSNDDAREALAAIANHRDDYLDAKSRMVSQEARIGAEPPQLAADLEAAGKEAGIQIPETVDRPPAPAGKRYLEHSLDVKLRKVGLKELAIFLSKIETNPRLIAITRLQIRHSFGEGDKLDVELTATAYERLKDDKRKKAAAPAAKGKG
jgi:Tfp pilus assembly protein PilO